MKHSVCLSIHAADLGGFDAFGERPGRDDVVDDSFAERLGHGVYLHEVLDAVEHIVVARRRRVHLLEDGRHVAEDRGVQQRCVHYANERRAHIVVCTAIACATSLCSASSLGCQHDTARVCC